MKGLFQEDYVECLQYSYLFLFSSFFGTSTFHGYMVSWRRGHEANVLDMNRYSRDSLYYILFHSRDVARGHEIAGAIKSDTQVINCHLILRCTLTPC